MAAPSKTHVEAGKNGQRYAGAAGIGGSFFCVFSHFFFLSSSTSGGAQTSASEVEQLLSPILESSQKQKVMILKRDPALADGQKTVEQERIPEKSLAQREKEYNLARERIFNEAAASSSSSSPSLGGKSANGGGGSGKGGGNGGNKSGGGNKNGGGGNGSNNRRNGKKRGKNREKAT